MSSVKRRGAPDEAELSSLEEADTGDVCDAISQREASVDDRLRTNTLTYLLTYLVTYLLSFFKRRVRFCNFFGQDDWRSTCLAKRLAKRRAYADSSI